MRPATNLITLMYKCNTPHGYASRVPASLITIVVRERLFTDVDYCVPGSNDVTDVKSCNIKEILTSEDAAISVPIM